MSIDLHMIKEEIVSFNLTDDGEIRIIRRIPSNMTYCNGSNVPDEIYLEVYVGDGDKIKLKQKTKGEHSPGYFKQESFAFPDAFKEKEMNNANGTENRGTEGRD